MGHILHLVCIHVDASFIRLANFYKLILHFLSIHKPGDLYDIWLLPIYSSQLLFMHILS